MPQNGRDQRSYSIFFSHAHILSDAVAELSDATLEFSAGGNWHLPCSVSENISLERQHQFFAQRGGSFFELFQRGIVARVFQSFGGGP